MKPHEIIVGQPVTAIKHALSKQLRRKMTPAERILWGYLRANRLQGMHFRRQQVIEGFIADFYCHSVALVIEVDGATHERQHDLERSAVFEGRGIRTLRFTNEEIYSNNERVLEIILYTLKQSHSVTLEEREDGEKV